MRCAIVATLVLAAMSSWATAQILPASKASASARPQAPNAQENGTPVSPAYVIGEGDVLKISVWHEPQFDETVEVRPDGNISMALISEVKVANLQPSAVKAEITRRLASFVKDPIVSIVVTQVRSKLVYIIGQVEHPGAYPLYTETNPGQLIARAGGVNRHAKTKDVYVLHAGKSGKTKVNYNKVLQGKDVKENSPLLPGDTVVVP